MEIVGRERKEQEEKVESWKIGESRKIMERAGRN